MFNTRILDRISSGICIADKDLKVVLWNVEMENITGVPGRDIAGSRLSDCFPRFSEESILMRLEMVLAGGPPIVFSPLLHRDLFRHSSANDPAPYLEITVTSLLDDDSSISILFTVKDVTELNLQILKYREMRDKALEEVELRQRVEEELKDANDKLLELANTDPLTGLFNRRNIEAMMLREFERYKRLKNVFSVIIGDIDYFKIFNDSYGHDCGDKVLIKTGLIMKENLRSLDIISRWGGEEFLILLPATGKTEAKEVAEKLRQIICSTHFVCDNPELVVTITFGVSEYQEGDTLKSFIKRADIALYEGKNRGRNCVVTS